MKKVILMFFLLCITANNAKAQYSFAYFPADTFMITQHKPDPYTLEWLYRVARNKGFELYDEIHNNKAFYIKALKEHIYDLKAMLNGGKKNYNYRTIIGSGLGALLSSSLFIGSTILLVTALKGFSNTKKYRRYEHIGISIIMISWAGLGAYLLHLSKRSLLNGLRTKGILLKELKRDIKILRALESN